jgi:hypothetical protein
MLNTLKRSNIGKLLLLTWSILCVVIFIYFPGRVSYIYSSSLVDLPFLAEKMQRMNMAIYIKDLFVSFVGIIIFLTSITALGAFIVRLLKFKDTLLELTVSNILAVLGTEFLIGHGILSLILIALGSLHEITPPYIISILVLSFLLGCIPLAKTIRELHRHITSKNSFITATGTYKIFCILSMIILVAGLLSTSARISYDATAIYFSDAKLTALTGHISYFTEDNFVASVFQSAIQYTALIELFGDQSARMLSWVCGVMTLIFGLALGKQVGLSSKAKIIFLTLTMTSTAFVDLWGDGKVDLISTASAIAAVYWIVVHSQSTIPPKKWLVLAGFLAGLSIVARPFNAFLMAFLVFSFYLWQAFLRRKTAISRFIFFIDSLFWFGLGAIGLGIYHLFVNWMILGNAFGFLSSISSINQKSGPWDANPNELLILRLLYPLVTAFRNSPQSLGNISPIVVAFLPTLLVSRIRKYVRISNELAGLSIISALTILIWIFSVFTVVEIRYVLFLWIILFLPAAEMVSSTLQDSDIVFKNIQTSTIFILLVFILFRAVFMDLNSYSPLDEKGNPQCHDFLLCKYLEPINQDAIPGDRVLTLSAYRYYLRTDLFACSTTHEEYKDLQTLSTEGTEEFWSEVYRQGYNYIAYENDYTTRHLGLQIIPSPRNTPEWISLERIDKPIESSTQTDIEDLVAAYKITIIGTPPIDHEKQCVENSGGWSIQEIEKRK